MPSAGIEHDVIELMEHRAQSAGGCRDIERECPTGGRKAEWRRICGAEAFEHGDEAGST